MLITALPGPLAVFRRSLIRGEEQRRGTKRRWEGKGKGRKGRGGLPLPIGESGSGSGGGEGRMARRGSMFDVHVLPFPL